MDKVRFQLLVSAHLRLPLVQQHLPEVRGPRRQDGSVQGDELPAKHKRKVAVRGLSLTAATSSSLSQGIWLFRPSLQIPAQWMGYQFERGHFQRTGPFVSSNFVMFPDV